MKVTNKEQGIKVVADVLDIIGGRWRGPILARLCDNPQRFNELKASLKRITSSTLTKELRYLEQIKIVERKVISTNPVVVEYHLSKHGSSIKDLIRSVIGWGLKHREVVLGKGKKGD
jgi:DNA-binding HxlR family transcriptional regulator